MRFSLSATIICLSIALAACGNSNDNPENGTSTEGTSVTDSTAKETVTTEVEVTETENDSPSPQVTEPQDLSETEPSDLPADTDPETIANLEALNNKYDSPEKMEKLEESMLELISEMQTTLASGDYKIPSHISYEVEGTKYPIVAEDSRCKVYDDKVLLIGRSADATVSVDVLAKGDEVILSSILSETDGIGESAFEPNLSIASEGSNYAISGDTVTTPMTIEGDMSMPEVSVNLTFGC